MYFIIVSTLYFLSCVNLQSLKLVLFVIDLISDSFCIAYISSWGSLHLGLGICMPTRSGRTFSVGETSVPMDPNLQDTVNTHCQDGTDESTITRV